MTGSVEALIIRHGFDMATAEKILERIESDLTRMRSIWHAPGRDDPPAWVSAQITELRIARDWLSDYHNQQWGRQGR